MTQQRSRRLGGRTFCTAALLSMGLLGAAVTAGCAPLGVAASKMTRTFVKPGYEDLKNQSVGVMVTVDRGTQIDHPRLQLDVAQSVQAKLQGAQANKAEELTGTTFPQTSSPAAIFAFQRNNPQLDVEPVVDVAPRLGVSRLIYVEIEAFTLNPADVLELFRGEVVGRVKVVEVTNGQAKVVFDDLVSAAFPEDAPPDGTPNLNRITTYRGAVDQFAVAVVQRFVAYETN